MVTNAVQDEAAILYFVLMGLGCIFMVGNSRFSCYRFQGIRLFVIRLSYGWESRKNRFPVGGVMVALLVPLAVVMG